MMPRRRRTRTQQRAADITAERHANHQARTNPKQRSHPEEGLAINQEAINQEAITQEAIPPPF